MIWFFLREAFCGLEYAENAFAATGGAHDAHPIVGWGGDTPPRPTSLGASTARVSPP